MTASMTSNHNEHLHGRDDTYWWFAARRKLLDDLLRRANHRRTPAEILDIVRGGETNFPVLNVYGRATTVVDREDALRRSPDREFATLVCSHAEHLPFRDDQFDIVIALDVLQTADRDVNCLAEIYRVLKPGGKIIVTAPAYGFLWSEHDEALQHRRRYTAHELRNKLARAGFELERVSYFAALLFFPIALARAVQNMFSRSMQPRRARVMLPAAVSSMIVGWLDFERALLRLINLPFGVSLIGVATKTLAQRVEVLDPVLQAIRARARLVSPSSAFVEVD
jgi:SAM-dependent methyltransferase